MKGFRTKSNATLQRELNEALVKLAKASMPELRKMDYEGATMLVLAMVVANRKLIAVTKFKGSKADKAQQARTLINLAATSTYVTVPLGTITALLALATVYLNSSPGGEQIAWSNLNNGILGMMSLFQIFANNNIAVAELAIKSGGFDVKKITSRKKQDWSAENNPVSGVIDLKATGIVGRGFHDWWISYDGAIYVRLDPTLEASTQIGGLATGKFVYFMHQIITKNGPQGFDLVIKKMVI